MSTSGESGFCSGPGCCFDCWKRGNTGCGAGEGMLYLEKLLLLHKQVLYQVPNGSGQR